MEQIMKEAASKATQFLEERFQNYTTQEKRDMAIMYMCGYFDAKCENGEGSNLKQIEANRSF